MFQELQKKAKAVLKKVNPSGGTVGNEPSTLRRRNSDYDTGSTTKLIDITGSTTHLYDNSINYRGYNDLGYKSNLDLSPKKNNDFLLVEGGIDRKNFQKPQTTTNLGSKVTNSIQNENFESRGEYLLHRLKTIVKDDILLKEQHVYIGGSIYLIVVQLFALFLLSSNDIAFVNGVLCGIAVVMLVLIFYFLFTYSHAYEVHEYCFGLRRYIMEELKRSIPTHIDFTQIPTTGIVQKSLHTYKGWVYLTNEYDPSKILADQNPSIAFLSFGKHSLNIYIVAIVCADNRRQRTSSNSFTNFNVVKHYRLAYCGVEFCILPENIKRSRYWAKKLPIKLSYSLGTLVSKRLDPFVSCYQKVLDKIDANSPCGPLPTPNQRYNNVTIDFDYSGGNIYLFALTGREKERWYRSLCLCVNNGPSSKSRTFRDMVEFSTVSVDPFSIKINFINKVKEILTHYKDINTFSPSSSPLNDNKPKTSTKNVSPLSYANICKRQHLAKDTTANNSNNKNKVSRKTANMCIQMNDEPLMLLDRNSASPDMSLPLNTNIQSVQQMVVNCDANVVDITPATTTTTTITTSGNKKNYKNDKINTNPPDNMLTMDYILSSKTTLALNLLAYRLTWDVWREDRWTNAIKTKIQTKINSLKLPPFIKKLTIEKLDLGDQLPVICSNCDPVLDSDGGIWLNLPLVYSGKLSMTFNTQLDVSIYDRLIVKAAKISSSHSSTTTGIDDDATTTTVTIDPFETSDATTNTISSGFKVDDPSDLVNLNFDKETTDIVHDNELDKLSPTSRLQNLSRSSNTLYNDDNISVDMLGSTYSPTKNDFAIDDDNNSGAMIIDDNTQSNTVLSSLNDDIDSDSVKLDRYPTIKMNQLLNSKSGKKLFNVVEKLAQSPFVKKIGRTEIAQKMYKAAKNKLSNLNVILTVNVTSLKGTLVLYIPPPPSDRLWFGFKTQPALALQISTRLNTKNIKLPALIQFIDSKLKSEFKDVLVLPNMEDIYIPLMSADIDYMD